MSESLILQAGFWGWLAASSLLLGAWLGFGARLSERLVAASMAFGSGVLIAALCFEQLPEAERLGGIWPTLGGLLAGGVVFVLADEGLDRLQARHRARRPGRGSLAGLLIAAGAFLDGIPESLALGLGLLDDGWPSLALLVAVLLANLPEGLASAASLRAEGYGRRQVFALWGVIVGLSGLAAMLGPALLADLSPGWLAFALGLSAGAVLCMLVDTLIPEAFKATHALTGLITLAGFMLAFALEHLS
ncbi:ZIP family metal transporter [Azotobacter vinelandii]|uniref:ZIP family metal transporter n=1 Tax=Azotobacter vinelandii TaxID=354 RepID=UPI000772F881|nr:hypothetical protein [Azotobacter vinelandii]